MEKLVWRSVRDKLGYRKILLLLKDARFTGRNAKARRDFNIPHSTFYELRKAFGREGKSGLKRE